MGYTSENTVDIAMKYYSPMSCAIRLTGLLYIHNIRLASIRMSIRLIRSAMRGANGKEAAKSWRKHSKYIRNKQK